ncbi:MAG: hypothetical protein KGN77_04440 [Xanthomonadaceae bacterium]|nr:hypothetical protein [Xanthomonadaceae bacterium]MDE1965417.1 hypothetical protein [Xanthomonadaceae bacterium]
MNTPDDRIARRARALYRHAGRHLDPAMAARLRAARRDAVVTPPAAHRAARLLLPAGAFAVIALAALMVWSPRHPVPAAGTPDTAAATGPASSETAELPPDADSADPALYQNLDFYGWLAANDPPPANER